MNHSRLWRLIDGSLRPYTTEVASGGGSLRSETVKDLLISLSQVCTQIHRWTLELDSDSGDEIKNKPADKSCSSAVLDPHPDEDPCMAKIFDHLMSLLGVENPYIQHLTGNILEAMSEFVIASETGWNEFMHLLCFCFNVAIARTLSSSLGLVVMEARDLEVDSSDSILFLKLKLENANYLTIASIVRVLRNILKLLKLHLDDKILQVYLDSISDSISNVPWDLLNEAFGLSNGEAPAGSSGLVSVHKDAAQLKSIAILHGNLVQLFCSLVDVSGQAGASFHKYRVVYEIRCLIPKLLVGYVGTPNVHLSKYLRHKILMLMMRLSLVANLEHSVIVSWLHLINKYFQDLLSQPIKVPESDQDDCLEGSPFWTDVVDAQTDRISSFHLQRLAIFIFLRCCLTLLSMKEKENKQFILASSESCLKFDPNRNSECSTRRGLLEVQNWLQSHLPGDTSVDIEFYSAKCMSFASSFLQLYMHEDDILFEMLLQMFLVPSYSRERIVQEVTSSAASNEILCLVSDIFNPIHFFHLFLAQILYDHQVLLDYLISKDTGAKCAEYLLKCLRVVCDSWNLFVEFPARLESLYPLCRKRRRVLADDMDLEEGCSTSLLRDELVPPPFVVECKKGHTCVNKHGGTKRVSFEDAKDCLFSLTTSIHSLDQKNLFPYNPQVLLRRLSRFQELCQK